MCHGPGNWRDHCEAGSGRKLAERDLLVGRYDLGFNREDFQAML
jgi:hypothetical protein